MKMTKQRKLMLEVLKSSKHPLNAENLLDLLPKSSMNLSTVYRNLDTFFEDGLISKSFLNQTTYYYFNHKDHHHYMICVSCHKMFEIDCHLEHISHDLSDKHDFKITHHDMTIYGYCNLCQSQ